MDDPRPRYSIGDLARLTGLSVRTIRFYGEIGVVPEAGRTPAGYRVYDLEAAERLGLVRSLRELGVDLPTIRQVLDHETTIAQVAGAHAEALDVQIRTLRLRRALLKVIAERGATPREVELMHKLAALSEAERRRMVEEFVDEVFAGVEADPNFVRQMRTSLPDLPEDPAPEQIDAWVELGGLISNPAFRRRIRRMAERYAEDGTPNDPERAAREQAATMTLAQQAEEARAAGLAPASPEAARRAGELLHAYAEALGRPDDESLRVWLLGIIDDFVDRDAERYWQLLAVVNGWEGFPSLVPGWEWLAATQRAEG